jgi:hypothetical protein
MPAREARRKGEHMGETNERGAARRLGVFAIPESKDGEKPFWPRIGVAFTNRDGSIAILLDALPLGTNRLQVRELRDDGRPAPGAAARRNGDEEVRT